MGITSTTTIPAPWIARAMYEFDTNQEFIGRMVAKPVKSMVQEGTLPRINRATLMGRNSSYKRAPGAAYQRGDIQTSGIDFKCESHGFEVPVPDEQVKIFGDIMPAYLNGGMIAAHELQTEHELAVKTALFNTTTWTGTSLYVDGSGTPWDAAGTDIIGNVLADAEKVRANTGMPANALVVGKKTMVNMLNNTGIKARFPGAPLVTAAMLRNSLPAIFDLKYLIVGGAVYNTANEGQTATSGDIWVDDYAMTCRIAETEDPSEPCVMRTVEWAAMGQGTNASTMLYREDQTDSTIVKAKMYYDIKVIAEEFGFLRKIDA